MNTQPKRVMVSITTPKEFSTFIQEHKYVVVKAEADWCNPCKRIKPLFMQKLNELPLSVALIVIDISKSPRLKNYLKIGSIPYMMNIIDGAPMDVLNTSNYNAIIGFFAKTMKRVTN